MEYEGKTRWRCLNTECDFITMYAGRRFPPDPPPPVKTEATPSAPWAGLTGDDACALQAMSDRLMEAMGPAECSVILNYELRNAFDRGYEAGLGSRTSESDRKGVPDVCKRFLLSLFGYDRHLAGTVQLQEDAARLDDFLDAVAAQAVANLSAPIKPYPLTPLGKDVVYYNGNGVRCDVAIGPCACGAWHTPEESRLIK